MNTQLKVLTRSILAGLVCAAGTGQAQITVSDDFTQATSKAIWTTFGTACLTAGTTANNSGGQIPKCTASTSQAGGYGDTIHPGGYMAAGVLDPVGNGALRLTNADGNDAGAIVYNSVFPSTSGIAVTFTSVSYDGNSGSGGGNYPISDGADGMSFFLVDSSVTPTNYGSYGGSLGYSCAQGKNPGNGATGGYIGLGIDEYGNFLNSGDNTATGVLSYNTSTGTYNTSSSSQFQGNRIGVRGIGMVNWLQLNANFPSYYPSSLSSSQQVTAVQNTCGSGTVWNYSGSTIGGVSSGNNMNCAVMVNSLPVTWTQLHAANSTYYPSSLTTAQQTSAVSNTCKTGTMWNYSSVTGTSTGAVNTGILVSSKSGSLGYVASSQTLYDYAPIQNTVGGVTSYASLAMPPTLVTTNDNLIANESAGARGNASLYTYNLKITSGGLLSLSYYKNGASGNTTNVLTNWPIFSTNGPLPANFKFGFAASTGGSNNVHEILCFQAAPADDSDTSVGINVIQTGQVKTNTQVYLAYYHSNDWWGQLTSQNLVYNSTTNTVTVATTANWDASCVLTGDTSGTTLPGGNCKATGSTSDTAEGPTARTIMTWDATAGSGIPFEWSGSSGHINTTQQGWLNAGDSYGQTRLAYLRGDRTNEVSPDGSTGYFRDRIGVLGDIVDSSPTWVGAPLAPYPSGAGAASTTWQDLLYPSTTMPENANTYGAYQTANASRLNVVFAGANDGMMHGFESGSFNSSGGFVSTNNDGKEVIAYMPNAVVQSIHNSSNSALDYSSPNYVHNYYVDATPGTGDLYYNNSWHTWLVGGLGAGGNAIYALDLTNPSNYSEANASSVVIGEWNSSTSTLGTNLGQTFGTPVIKRFHSNTSAGSWGFVFGNGYNAPSHNGGVFIGLVSSGGSVSFVFLPLPASANGTASSPNGVFSAYAADYDGDGIADFIYAGDMQGNVWRWDVTSQSPSTWASTTPVQIFAAGSGQPISTQVQVLSVPNPGGPRRIMVDFGTGSQIPSTSGTSYATGQQALYGIWDGNVSAWNALTTTSAHQYDAYPAAHTVVTGDLQSQSVTGTGVDSSGIPYRKMSNKGVCWADLTSCSAPALNNQYGWIYQFAAPSSSTVAGEQVVFNPVVEEGAFVVNTYVPALSQTCTVYAPSGWTMAINPATGGAFQTSFFVNSSNIIESQVQLGATGSPSFVVANSVAYLVSQTLANGATVNATQPPAGAGYRLNWTELR
ncbi:MAG: pilus assembly protein PilY [Burkholderiaceae bacterium]|nr:pilus assembly protein PilY [Burkholderiaceae bacterium]